MKELLIQGQRIAADAPCFVIAEAGVNHNGDVALAHRLVDAAADARANAIKFQTFEADALVSADAPKAAYQVDRTGSHESQRDMLRRLQLPRAAHVELQRHAGDRGLIMLSTPFEAQSADFLEELGVPAFKVASGEITNHRFLAYLAGKGRPLLVSTGMSDLEEVEGAVAAIEAAGAPSLALFHCTSSYPAPEEFSNLRAIDTLARRFDLCVGYSDHTLGFPIPWAAVALGARLLEKHLTLDRSLPGPDHAASMEPKDFVTLIEGVRRIESGLGTGEKIVQACERETQRVARKSLFAAAHLAAGTSLRETDLVSRRPGTGISPARLSSLIGRRLARAVDADTMLRESDLE